MAVKDVNFYWTLINQFRAKHYGDMPDYILIHPKEKNDFIVSLDRESMMSIFNMEMTKIFGVIIIETTKVKEDYPELCKK